VDVADATVDATDGTALPTVKVDNAGDVDIADDASWDEAFMGIWIDCSP